MSHKGIESLSGCALEYEFCKAVGMEVFGIPGGPFALRTDQSLLLFNTDCDGVSNMSFTSSDALYPFEVALELNASFVAEDGVVSCRIGKTTATGLSYSEAAMRAITAHAKSGAGKS